MARKKIEMLKSTVGALPADGFSELEALGSELREWYDNLPESFRDNRSDIDEAASALENISEPGDAPEAVRDIEVEYCPARNATSRRARRDQVTYELSVAIEAAQAWLDDKANAEHADHDEVEYWISEVQNMLDEADGVDFPGMHTMTTKPLPEMLEGARIAAGFARKDGVHCVKCRAPFSDANTHTAAGWKDTQITGLCEDCFDGLFSEE